LKGSVWNQKWCLKECFFEGSLRHLYRFFGKILVFFVCNKGFFRLYSNITKLGLVNMPYVKMLANEIKGSLWNQKWCLKEPLYEGYLKNYFRTWFFKEPWFERFFVEPKMVLLRHHSEEPFSVPDDTFMFLCEEQLTRFNSDKHLV